MMACLHPGMKGCAFGPILQGEPAAIVAAEPESSSGSDEEEEKPGYIGLDDSDMEEWLESSSEGSVRALTVAKPPELAKMLTATVWRGARESPGGDACRTVPPNR